MKFNVKREKMERALQKVCNIIGNKTTLPVIANVLLEAENGKLVVTATDLELRITTSIDAEIETPGRTTIPAKRLFGLVSKFKADVISFDSNENFHSKIKCGTAEFMIMGLSPDDFPAIPDFSPLRSIKIKQADFSRMIDRISYAVSFDDSRKVLQGIFLSVKDGNLTAVATDGKRLALVEKMLDEVSEGSDGDIIVTLKAASELKRILEKEGDAVIEIDQKEAVFKVGETVVYSKLIDGNYPNYKQVIPADFSKKVPVSCSDFIDALDIVSVSLFDVSSSFVKITFSNGKLMFEASSNVGEGQEQIPVEYEGDDIALSFNPQFLADPFKHVGTDKVSIKMNDGYKPIAIESSDGFLYVIMPMRNK